MRKSTQQAKYCALAVCSGTKVTEIPQLKAQLSSLPPSYAVVKDSTDYNKLKLKKVGQGIPLPFLLQTGCPEGSVENSASEDHRNLTI